MAKKKFGLGILLIVLAFGIPVVGCSTVLSISTFEIYDNNVLKEVHYRILSNDLVRIEFDLIDKKEIRFGTVPVTRNNYDRILEQVKVQYPHANAVLIAASEVVLSETKDPGKRKAKVRGA